MSLVCETMIILLVLLAVCSSFRIKSATNTRYKVILSKKFKIYNNLRYIEAVDFNHIKQSVDSADNKSKSIFTATFIGAFVSYMYYYELRALFVGAIITNVLARSKSGAGSLLRIWGYSMITFLIDLKNSTFSNIINIKTILSRLIDKYNDDIEEVEVDTSDKEKLNIKLKHVVSKRFDELITSDSVISETWCEEEKFRKRSKVEYQLRVPVRLTNKVSTLMPKEEIVVQNSKKVSSVTDTEWSNSDLTQFKEWGKGIEWNQVKEQGSDLYKKLQENIGNNVILEKKNM